MKLIPLLAFACTALAAPAQVNLTPTASTNLPPGHSYALSLTRVGDNYLTDFNEIYVIAR